TVDVVDDSGPRGFQHVRRRHDSFDGSRAENSSDLNRQNGRRRLPPPLDAERERGLQLGNPAPPVSLPIRAWLGTGAAARAVIPAPRPVGNWTLRERVEPARRLAAPALDVIWEASTMRVSCRRYTIMGEGRGVVLHQSAPAPAMPPVPV